jgi:hypothetical protein
MTTSNASIFRRLDRVEREMRSLLMPTLPSGVRSPFVYRSDRRGEIVAAVAGTRLVRPEVVRG